MKAILCKEYGPPEKLVIEEADSPSISDDQILVDVHAAGVNFPDTLIIQNLYQFKPPLPFSPGSEVSGVVKAVGKNVTRFKEGDEVMGFSGWGAFAEEMAVPAASAHFKPKNLSFEEAASFVMVYGTSYYGLKQRGQLQAGETLLVLGAAGGVGMAALELGKLMGAKVIAAASSDDKLAICKERGADFVINYSDGNLKDKVKEITAGQGADVIYDPVGGDLFLQAARCVNWGGRILVIGFASGTIPQLPVNLTLLKSSSVVGVFWGASVMREPQTNQENFEQLLKWTEEGKIKPHVCQSFPMDQVANALHLMLERKVVGKTVIKMK